MGPGFLDQVPTLKDQVRERLCCFALEALQCLLRVHVL